MKLSNLLTVNAVLALAFGIAFALYGPLMIAFFNVADIQSDNSILYWMIASFARLFGAAIFGTGLLLWAVRGGAMQASLPAEARRGLIFALLLANGMALFVAITQQFSIWGSLAGWVAIIIFALLAAGYAYFLVRG